MVACTQSVLINKIIYSNNDRYAEIIISAVIIIAILLIIAKSIVCVYKELAKSLWMLSTFVCHYNTLFHVCSSAW